MKQTIAIACILACVVAAVAAPAKPAAQSASAAATAAWKTYPEAGPFIMCLARDGSGNVWAGTEGNGIWRFGLYAVTNQWQQFKAKELEARSQELGAGRQKPEGDESGKQKTENGSHLTPSLSPGGGEGGSGLGDDYVYSVAVDKQGRVWAGHLNHGVSVFNGSTWKNYDMPYGPIGERIFKIAVCPTDGDVWIGTSAGLTRYSVSKDTWTHYTKGQIGNPKSEIGNVPGLPGDQITAIAFDARETSTSARSAMAWRWRAGRQIIRIGNRRRWRIRSRPRLPGSACRRG